MNCEGWKQVDQRPFAQGGALSEPPSPSFPSCTWERSFLGSEIKGIKKAYLIGSRSLQQQPPALGDYPLADAAARRPYQRRSESAPCMGDVHIRFAGFLSVLRQSQNDNGGTERHDALVLPNRRNFQYANILDGSLPANHGNSFDYKKVRCS